MGPAGKFDYTLGYRLEGSFEYSWGFIGSKEIILLMDLIWAFFNVGIVRNWVVLMRFF